MLLPYDFNSCNYSNSSAKDLQRYWRSIPIAHIAKENQTRRKFVHEQKAIAAQALDESFLSDKRDDEVLFYLPITKTWLLQLILALVFIYHSSSRGVVV